MCTVHIYIHIHTYIHIYVFTRQTPAATQCCGTHTHFKALVYVLCTHHALQHVLYSACFFSIVGVAHVHLIMVSGELTGVFVLLDAQCSCTLLPCGVGVLRYGLCYVFFPVSIEYAATLNGSDMTLHQLFVHRRHAGMLMACHLMQGVLLLQVWHTVAE